MNRNVDVLLVALPYATADLHLGRLAGTFIPADIFRRYKRIYQNKKCEILSGLDCYGSGVYMESMTSGVRPNELIHQKFKSFVSCLKQVSVSMRYPFLTAQTAHTRYVRKKLNALIDQGRIERKSVEKRYCPKCDVYCTDRLLVTENNQCLEKLIETDRPTDGCVYCSLCLHMTTTRTIQSAVLKYDKIDSTYDAYVKELNIDQDFKQLTRQNLFWGVKASDKVAALVGSRCVYYVWIEALYAYIEQIDRLRRKHNVQNYYYFYGKDNNYYHKIVLTQLEHSNPLRYTCNDRGVAYSRNYFQTQHGKISGSNKDQMITLQSLKTNNDVLRYSVTCFDTMKSDSVISAQSLKQKSESYFKKYVNLVKRVAVLMKLNHVSIASSVQANLLTDVTQTYVRNYRTYMSSSRLTNAISQIELFQRQICRIITDYFKSRSERALVLIANLVFQLLKLLEPFTPITVKQLRRYYINQIPFRFDVQTLTIKNENY